MNVMIVQPNEDTPSETFLRVHAKGLPANVTVLYGARPRVCGQQPDWNDRFERTRIRVQRMLAGESAQWENTELLLRHFRRFNPAVVLAEYGPTGVRVMDACRRASIPLVVHFHGYDASQHDVLREHAEGYKRLFEHARAIIAVSRVMQRRLIDMGASPDKVHWKPCGIDCDGFGGSDPASAPPTFVAVGRFADKKSPHLTILAFAEVLRKRPEARLRMIGTGPLFNFCKELAGHMRLGDAVTFLGAQPHEVVKAELRAARAFVQHSVIASNGDSEGTPVAVGEAGASGLPLVSTRHAGIPDVVVEGETGFLVDEHDVHQMAVHMRQLVDDPQLAARLGRTAQERIREHFSQRIELARLWSILRSCVKESRSAQCAANRSKAA